MSTSASATQPATQRQAGPYAIQRGSAIPFGATPFRRGVNFAIFSKEATSCTLVLIDPATTKTLAELAFDPLRNRTGNVWHMFVENLDPGVHYVYRFDMQPNPNPAVYRFNPAVLLLDPYARAIAGGGHWGAAPAAAAPQRYGVIREWGLADWQQEAPLNTPLVDSVIYELHVRGFTVHETSMVAHPGTFAGLAEKIPYLKQLGVTAVELLPVNEFEEADTDRVNPFTGEMLLNYWGYQPRAFFAPNKAYSSATGDGDQVNEFKQMVEAFHKAGIEVILDIVFNHTAEGDEHGPTFSFRGIDNPTYYMVNPQTGVYDNFTGCGNTVNCNNPVVRDFIVQCLRYWVLTAHVDGFRFDLAAVLGRGQDGSVLANPPLLESLAYDPVLANTKLIAEAWDAAGLYQVGTFPSWGRWAEWNGKFRDDVRKFVKGDPGMTSPLATRMLGSPDLYETSAREPYHSINFITCHDGFTLNDLVSYNDKHNLANGENNSDGGNDNNSWNCGAEGPTGDADVQHLRERQRKNFATILLMAHGVPMLLAGDEFARTQQGNNNAYCQDNDISWVNWHMATANADLVRFFRLLIAFRKRTQMLRRSVFNFSGSDGFHVTWHGVKRISPDWGYDSRTLAMQLTQVNPDGSRQDVHFIANTHWEDRAFELPQIGEYEWFRLVDTSQLSPNDIADEGQEFPLLSQDNYTVKARSVAVFVGK
jgi:glycogen operon protein